MNINNNIELFHIIIKTNINNNIHLLGIIYKKIIIIIILTY